MLTDLNAGRRDVEDGPSPMNSVKKSPQRKPVVARLKTAVSGQSVRQPVAPPVYRPQPVPGVLQRKNATGPHTKLVAMQPKMAGKAIVLPLMYSRLISP